MVFYLDFKKNYDKNRKNIPTESNDLLMIVGKYIKAADNHLSNNLRSNEIYIPIFSILQLNKLMAYILINTLKY